MVAMGQNIYELSWRRFSIVIVTTLITYLANSFNGNGFYGPKYELSNISMVTVSMNWINNNQSPETITVAKQPDRRCHEVMGVILI